MTDDDLVLRALREVRAIRERLASIERHAAAASREAQGPPVFTTEQIADRSFWEANRDAILAAVREGRIVDLPPTPPPTPTAPDPSEPTLEHRMGLFETPLPNVWRRDDEARDRLADRLGPPLFRKETPR